MCLKTFAHFTSGHKYDGVWGGAFAHYFRPHRRVCDSLSALAPGNLPSISKKSNFPGPGRGSSQLELTDACYDIGKNAVGM